MVHPIKLTKKVITGDNKNKPLLALLGSIISFIKSLNPSERGCNKPNTPTTLGPIRLCIIPKIFRSANVKYATATRRGTIIIKVFIITIKR